MELKSKLDVFPTVSVGIGYGELVDNFEPDMLAITDHLRKAGLTDEQIVETKIHFSDECYPREKDKITFGNYNNRKKLITIYGMEEVLVAGYVPDRVEPPELNIADSLAHELEHRISRFDPEQQKLNRRYEFKKNLVGKRSAITIAMGFLAANAANEAYTHLLRPNPTIGEFLAISLGSCILAMKTERVLFRNQLFNEYLDHPEEKRARSAKLGENLIKIAIKEQG